MKEKPAICCLGYNRPDSMKRLLNSIGLATYNDEGITLIISIDECDKSDSVEEVARLFEWKHGKKIIKRYEKRLGVRGHTLTVGDFSKEYGSVVYLEDDIVVAPGFYTYLQNAIEFYRKDERIFGVALYNQRWLGTAQSEFVPAYNGADAYLFRGDISWGQCWIDTEWEKFHKWYDENKNSEFLYTRNVPKSVQLWNTKSSWSKFISYYMAFHEKYYAVPYVSYSTCFSDKGVHTGSDSDQCQVPLNQNVKDNFRFYKVEECVKYDSYFERSDSFVNEIEGFSIAEICIDFNGEKYDWNGYKAILTTKKIDQYDCIASYGVNLDPIEANIIYKTPGNTIRLYRIPDSENDTSWYDKIMVPLTCKDRVIHQIGKYRTKNLFELLRNKIIEKVFNLKKENKK